MQQRSLIDGVGNQEGLSEKMTFKLNEIFKNIYFFLAVLGLPCCMGFSLVAVCGGYSSRWLLWLRSTVSGVHGLQWLWLPGSGAQAQ